MIKIYYVPSRKVTREYLLIKQGLVNNPRVELVKSVAESDFVFLFYTTLKHYPLHSKVFPPNKTVFIDYHDKHFMIFDVDCKAYFKRSWVEEVNHGQYSTKRARKWPPHFHPISFAIMDEFITDEQPERDITLSCTIRPHARHVNRPRVLSFIKGMKIPGKTQIGEFNSGNMKRFNDPDMKEYFNLLKRSRIVVTCNPSRWEGDFRTWETFASGALVFIDRMYIPMKHPLVDGKHCIFYDTSGEGLLKMEKMILHLIAKPELAVHIAREGHDFAMRYHRASNRIDEILEQIL